MAHAKTESNQVFKLIEEVRVVPPSDNDFKSHDYFIKLLTLALSNTEDEFGPFQIVPQKTHLLQDRAFHELNKASGINVFWTVSSSNREKLANAVKIPLLNGMFGYRIALVMESKVNKFINAKDTGEIRRLLAGQGHDWPDLQILHHNDFNVMGTSAYDSLLELLKRNRIDYIPRGVGEILREYDGLNSELLAIEPKYMFYYPSFMYFFVDPSNKVLAKRIEKGLKIAIENGSFDKAFRSYIDIKQLNSRLKLDERQVISLENPYLDGPLKKIPSPFWLGTDTHTYKAEKKR